MRPKLLTRAKREREREHLRRAVHVTQDSVMSARRKLYVHACGK